MLNKDLIPTETSAIFNRNRYALISAALLFLFLTAIISGLRVVRIDMVCWENWSINILHDGLRNAYSLPKNDYPPVYQYILWIFAKMAGSDEAIRHYSGYLRVFTLAFEYWGLWIVYRWTNRRVDFVFILMCSMLNIAYSYDTMLWGQVDAILSAFVISALFFVHTGRRLWSVIFMVLALNMKLQAIVFVPLWGLMMIASLQTNRRWKEVFVLIPVMIATQAALLFPFMLGRAGVAPVWHVISGLVDAIQWISINAFNMWYWIAKDASAGNPDSETGIFGLSYYHIGLISFSIALFASLWPVLRYTIRSFWVRGLPPLDRETIWLVAALSALVFFFFNTRMHERYSHPAFIFLAAYAFYTGRFGLYILFSLAFLLNMERAAAWFEILYYQTLAIDPRYVAGLFAACIIWAGALLYGGDRRPFQKLPVADGSQLKDEAYT